MSRSSRKYKRYNREQVRWQNRRSDKSCSITLAAIGAAVFALIWGLFGGH